MQEARLDCAVDARDPRVKDPLALPVQATSRLSNSDSKAAMVRSLFGECSNELHVALEIPSWNMAASIRIFRLGTWREDGGERPYLTATLLVGVSTQVSFYPGMVSDGLLHISRCVELIGCVTMSVCS